MCNGNGFNYNGKVGSFGGKLMMRRSFSGDNGFLTFEFTTTKKKKI
jgi:hypothetical protein